MADHNHRIAHYVLDGVYGHESRIDIDEHYVDTGGVSDHLFSLFAIGGKRIAPRLRDLADWRLHSFEGANAYPAVKHHSNGIGRACWALSENCPKIFPALWPRQRSLTSAAIFPASISRLVTTVLCG